MVNSINPYCCQSKTYLYNLEAIRILFDGLIVGVLSLWPTKTAAVVYYTHLAHFRWNTIYFQQDYIRLFCMEKSPGFIVAFRSRLYEDFSASKYTKMKNRTEQKARG